MSGAWNSNCIPRKKRTYRIASYLLPPRLDLDRKDFRGSMQSINASSVLSSSSELRPSPVSYRFDAPRATSLHQLYDTHDFTNASVPVIMSQQKSGHNNALRYRTKVRMHDFYPQKR